MSVFNRITMVFRKLWQNDCGAVISSELILILSVGTFGIVSGIAILRNMLNSCFENFSENMQRTVQWQFPSHDFSSPFHKTESGICSKNQCFCDPCLCSKCLSTNKLSVATAPSEYFFSPPNANSNYIYITVVHPNLKVPPAP